MAEEKQYTFEEAVLELVKRKDIYISKLRALDGKAYATATAHNNKEPYAVRKDKLKDKDNYSFAIGDSKTNPLRKVNKSYEFFQLAPDDLMFGWVIIEPK